MLVAPSGWRRWWSRSAWRALRVQPKCRQVRVGRPQIPIPPLRCCAFRTASVGARALADSMPAGYVHDGYNRLLVAADRVL